MAAEVTRIEIADHLAHLFGDGGRTRDDLLKAVVGARPEVREVLARLPERRYTALRQVWEDLPMVPVGV
jgi:hypothetical protein